MALALLKTGPTPLRHWLLLAVFTVVRAFSIVHPCVLLDGMSLRMKTGLHWRPCSECLRMTWKE